MSNCTHTIQYRNNVVEIESASESRHLEIQVKVSKDLPPCVMDKMAINRLLTNLLDNAVKFSSSDDKVQISCNFLNGEIVLKVSDTGKGIAQSDSVLIFEKCKRSERDKYTPGSRLGVYICREIAKAHGGNISFESKIGTGSIFTVRLPAKSCVLIN